VLLGKRPYKHFAPTGARTRNQSSGNQFRTAITSRLPPQRVMRWLRRTATNFDRCHSA